MHDFDINAARRMQEELRSRLLIRGGQAGIRYVAGLDGAYGEGDRESFAAAVLYDLRRDAVIESVGLSGAPGAPYRSGFLSFREAPLAMAAVARLARRPEALLCDGQGIAHPRRMGLAAHLGVLLDLPSVGCAKSRLCGDFEEPGPEPGAASPLRYQGEQVGVVLRTRTGCRPLFVSPGHRLGIAAAARLAMRSLRGHRSPEPIRLAHLLVTEMRRQKEHDGCD